MSRAPCAPERPFGDPAPWPLWREIIDRAVAALVLLVVLPWLLLLALVVRLDSPGPMLARDRRVGRFGEEFDLLRFRSTVLEVADGAADRRVLRVTRAGRLLRSTCLDELPQLINVLRGEMSLVGPRPRPVGRPSDIIEIPSVLSVKPGLIAAGTASRPPGARVTDVRDPDHRYGER